MIFLLIGALLLWLTLIAGFLALARAAALGDRAVQRLTPPKLIVIRGDSAADPRRIAL